MKKHKRKILIGINSLLLLCAVFFFTGHKAFASPDESTLIPLYDKFEYILSIDDGYMIKNLGRSILWGIIVMLSSLNNFIEGAVRKIVGVNGFYNSPAMERIMDLVVPLAFGLFVIAIIFLGFQFMMNKIEKREEIILNVTLAVAIIFLIPILVTQMHKVLGIATDHTKGLNQTLSGSIVQSNVADLFYYAEKDFVVDESGTGNKTTPPLPQSKTNKKKGTTDFTYANRLSKSNPQMKVNETVDIKESIWGNAKNEWAKNIQKNNPTAYEFLKHQKLPTGVGDESTVMELNKNIIPGTNIGKEAYYRYHVNWGVVIFTLAVTTFALAITVIKVGRMMFDIAFTQFFAMFVAVTDLTGGQRTKKVLVELANSFGVLFIMMFIMQLFVFYTNWVNGLRADIGTIPVILMLIAGAWAVMDAPDIVQRMMGIDAGLRSGYGALMGAYAGASLAGKGGQMAKNLAGSAMTKGAGIAGAMKGAFGREKGKSNNPSKIPSGNGSGTGNNNIDSFMNKKENQNGSGSTGNQSPKQSNQGVDGSIPSDTKEESTGTQNQSTTKNNQGVDNSIPSGTINGSTGTQNQSTTKNNQGVDNSIPSGTVNESTGTQNQSSTQNNQGIDNSIPSGTVNESTGTQNQSSTQNNQGIDNSIPSGTVNESTGTQNQSSTQNNQGIDNSIPSGTVNESTGTQNQSTTKNNQGIDNSIPSGTVKKSTGTQSQSSTQKNKGTGTNSKKSKGQSKIKRNFNNQSIGQLNKGNVPSGWTQTNSGIVIPIGSASNLNEGISSNTSDVGSVSINMGGQSDVIPSGATNINIGSQTDMPPVSNVNMGGQEATSVLTQQITNLSSQIQAMQQPTGGYGGTGGIVTGSGLFNRMRHSFNRGQATGAFLRQGTSTVVKGVGKASIGTVRAIRHPQATVSYVGSKISNLGRGVSNFTSKTSQNTVNGVNNIVSEINTPIGSKQKSQSQSKIKINNENIRNENIRDNNIE